MFIITAEGHSYFYNAIDNSIVDDDTINPDVEHYKFKPLGEINNLPEVCSFTLGVTERCNLRCSYCCYSGHYKEHRKHSSKQLPINDIKPVIDFMVKYSTKDVITVDFYGGESLLKFDWIKEFVKNTRQTKDKTWEYELSTNGILLNQEVVEWLVNNGFKIFVSVDGIEDDHDRCRKDAGGHNTFSRIYDNLTYIKSHYGSFWESNVNIMMTVQDITRLPGIAERWVSSPLFQDKMPYRISEVSTVYNNETQRIDEETEIGKYIALVDWYKGHPDNGLIKTFFNIWLAEWINRPIMELEECEYPTCIPNNRKLYIDATGSIGICERISDAIRIGSLTQGIDYTKVNSIAKSTASFIESHCSRCEIARVCDLCPDILKISDDIQETYCHNQKVIQRVKLRCFCELAEVDLI